MTGDEKGEKGNGIAPSSSPPPEVGTGTGTSNATDADITADADPAYADTADTSDAGATAGDKDSAPVWIPVVISTLATPGLR